MAEPLISDETLRALYNQVAREFGAPDNVSPWEETSDKRRELARLMRDLLRWWARFDHVYFLSAHSLAAATVDAAYRLGLFPLGWDEANEAAVEQHKRFAIALLDRATDEQDGAATPLDQIQDT